MGALKMIFGFLLIVAAVVAGFKLAPVYFSNYEFQDYIKNEALQSTYATRSEEDIREAVLKHARDLDIPLTGKQVRVSRSGSGGAGAVTIEAEYSVPLEVPGYSTTLDFHPSSTNKGVF